jgi:hypothetical protein
VDIVRIVPGYTNGDTGDLSETISIQLVIDDMTIPMQKCGVSIRVGGSSILDA